MAKALTPDEALEKAYYSVLKFPEGILVMKHILELTRYNHYLKTFNPETSELNIHATIYNLSKRDIWIEIRKFLTPEQQAFIEQTEMPQLVKHVEPKQLEEKENE